jgi:lipoprotein-anchoring transpeptidase ErfK/SrfK
MDRRWRDIVIFVVGLTLVLGTAYGGYATVRARAHGYRARQVLASVKLPSVTPGAPQAPQYERWTVGKALGPVTVFRQPKAGATVMTRLGKSNQNGYPTLVLVDSIRDRGAKVWYRVWLAQRPNGSRGWVPEGELAFYTVSSKIVIDLSERKLRVFRRGELKGTFPVAVGQPGLSTPTGFFFVNQKLKPPSPGGPYGALALGTSAFQPKLTYWPQGGPVAIHGTNEDYLIGRAVSHGCVRMHDKDVLEVSRLVPAGSPVVIQK